MNELSVVASEWGRRGEKMRKNIIKRVVCVAVAFVIAMSTFSVFAAAQMVEPYFNNVVEVSNLASVSSTGKLTITNRMIADSTVFNKAIITTYVEKKVLGLFWSRVDIGQTNDKWIDVIYTNSYVGTHTFQLSDKGTYKVTTEFVVFGSGGPADTITRTATTQYK